MRKPSACAVCRSRRRKCQFKHGQIVCQYCRERSLHCDLSPPQGGYYQQRERAQQQQQLDHAAHVQARPQAETQDQQGQNQNALGHAANGVSGGSRRQSSGVVLPGLAVRLDLVRLYFDFIGDQMHGLFHKPSLIEDVLNDRVPIGILCGIMALSARFSTDPYFAEVDPRDRGHGYLHESEALLNLRNVSLTTIQHCVLLGACLSSHGNGQAENTYYTIGCRMAQLLDLPNQPAANALESETNLRVWWSLVMIDVWSSTGCKLPRLMPTRLDLPLPMDDLAYLSMSPDGGSNHDSPGPASFSRGSRLLAAQVTLNRILDDINTFNQRCVAENPAWDALELGVEALTARLDDWYATLAASLRDSPDNFAWFASRGLGRVFAAVYLGYYHYGQLLYYQFLHSAATETESNGGGHPHAAAPERVPVPAPASAPPATTATATAAPSSLSPGSGPMSAPALLKREVYARRCKDHSARLCEMVYRSHATADADVRYFMTSHVLVIASTVQIHTLLFSGDEDDIVVARRRLERNFELLLRLQVYWPPVDRAIGRLRAFHATARKSVGSSFVLDRWMLRFLVEFAETMEEREAEDWRSASEEMEALWNR